MHGTKHNFKKHVTLGPKGWKTTNKYLKTNVQINKFFEEKASFKKQTKQNYKPDQIINGA